jgi:hypothetical protein
MGARWLQTLGQPWAGLLSLLLLLLLTRHLVFAAGGGSSQSAGVCLRR